MSGPVRLLMVEDSSDDADLTLRFLRRSNLEILSHRVDTAEGFLEALQGEKWDLVICDYSMPHFSGLDALRLLRSRNSDTPFIFLSGTIGEETAVAALREGAQDYLMKSNIGRLVPAVQRALREKEERRTRELLQKQVSELQRFESIGRLAGGIAHDFNNMLGVVSGFAQLGFEEAPPDSRARQRFQKIRDQAEHAAALTAQLLAFARRQILQPRNVNLNELVTKTLNLVDHFMGQPIHIETSLAPNLDIAHVDPTQIEQVLMNLLLNARDAMPRGGQIVIATRNVDIGDEFVQTHPDVKKGKYIAVLVSDTGMGMDAATRERIFEPFFTTKEIGKGTGLGLATVFGVVKQHNGIVEVQSEPGKGTTFHVYFPAQTGVADVQAVTPIDRVPHGRAKENGMILFVEDQPGIREIALEWLQSRGYKVIEASDGREAVSKFRENAHLIQLVILDIMMPILGGDDAYRQMCAIRPDFQVIFTSGHSSESAHLTGGPQDHAIFLQKPYSLHALGESVRRAMDRQRSLVQRTGKAPPGSDRFEN